MKDNNFMFQEQKFIAYDKIYFRSLHKLQNVF